MLDALEFFAWTWAPFAALTVGVCVAYERVAVPRLRTIGTPIALLLLQPDFSTAVVLVGVIGLLLFAAGLPLQMLLAPAAWMMVDRFLAGQDGSSNARSELMLALRRVRPAAGLSVIALLAVAVVTAL